MKNTLTLITILFSLTIYGQDQILDTSLKTIDGKETNLTEITKDNDLVMVSLWATWCVPCKNELDAISEVYDEWVEETGVKLIAVSVDDSRTVNRVKPLVNGKDWDFTILLDTNNDLKRALNAVTVPLVVIIKNGEIVYRHSGYTPGSEEKLLEELIKLK